MRFVEPKIFMLAKMTPKKDEILQWLFHLGVSKDKAIYLASGEDKTSAEQLIELYGRRCYMSFEIGLNPNVQKIREDIKEYIENILRSEHGSVLEHVYYTFAIENVSRVFTGEMNRHRAGVAISEGSMRYIRYDDIPICDVPSIQPNENMLPADGVEFNISKKRSREIIKASVEYVETYYKNLIGVWKSVLDGKEFAGKKHITSMLRRIIPMGVATGGVWTFNVRALRHMLTMRAAKAAEEEIAVVAVMILERMMKDEPILFGDFGKDEEGFYKPKYRKV